MVEYFILIKRKGAKKWSGALPTKKGITKLKLKKLISKQIKNSFSYKIITGNQLKRLLKMKKRTRTKQRTKKKTKRKILKKGSKRRY